MNIVHIIPSLNLGGGEKFAVDVCNELSSNKNNQVCLIVLQKIDKNSILFNKIDDKVNVLSANKVNSTSLKTFFVVLSLLSKLRPDVINTHLRGLIYSSLAIVILRVPTIHTVHTLADKEIGAKVRFIYKHLFDKFNVYPVAISNTVLDSMKKEYGIFYSTLISNGVSKPVLSNNFIAVKETIGRYKKNDKTKVFLIVASINDNKNQLMLIEVFNSLYKKLSNVILLIAGDGQGLHAEYLQHCKEAAKNSENIYFLGPVADVGDYLMCADVLCLSSKYEGLPLVILEAMSFGIPAIATPAGGIPDVIKNGINGYVSEGFDSKSFENAVEKFIAREEGFKKLVIENDYMNKYSIGLTVEKYVHLYNKIISMGYK